MQSRVRVARHPTHPMLVMFPTAMFPLLVLLDVLAYYFRGDLTFWSVGFWVAIVGAVSTVAAMIPGIVDLAAIPDDTPAHRTAFWHFLNGCLILVLFLAAIAVRWPAGSGDARLLWATIVDVVGVIAITVQGWLGGELVYKHHIGVLSLQEGADPVLLKQAETGSRVARADARRPGVGRP